MNLKSVLNKVLLPLGVLAFFAVVWFGLYRPEMAKISEYRNKPLATRQQIESIAMQLSSFEEPTDSERAQWDTLGLLIQRRMPKGMEITSLYSDLSRLVEKDSLIDFQRELVELAGGAAPAVSEEGGIAHSSFDLKLTFQCGFGALLEFLRDIRALDRLVEVTSLDITRGMPHVTVSLNLKCYYTPE
ncbi:hypothetical protein LLH00_08460 [bacterium]|nr:hypothetical protein [bacterium]